MCHSALPTKWRLNSEVHNSRAHDAASSLSLQASIPWHSVLQLNERLHCSSKIYNQAYVLCAWCSLWLRWSIFPSYQNSSCGFSLGSARISRLTKPCFPIRSHSIVHFLFLSSTLDSDCCYTTCFTLSCYHELLCLYSPTRSQAPGSHADLRHEYISQIGRTWMYSNASPSFLIQCWLQGFHKTAGMMKSH